jgi:hypothetical protein
MGRPLEAAERRGWISEATVWAVELHNDWLWYMPARGVRGVYSPMLRPELLDGALALRTDADILAFARAFGPFGWESLASGSDRWPVWMEYLDARARQRRRHGGAFGEPLEWVIAHVATLRWSRQTASYVQTREHQPRKPSCWAIGADLVGGTKRRWRREEGLHTLPDYDFDGELLEALLNENLRWTTEEFFWWDEALVRRRLVGTLVEALYVHLSDSIVGVLRTARCDECGAAFLKTDARQRFCPHPAGDMMESRCASRARARRARERRRAG